MSFRLDRIAAPRRSSAVLSVAIGVGLLFGSAANVAVAETAVGCDPPPAPQSLDAARPINLGQLRLRLIYYRCTRYDAEVAAVLRKARRWVETASRRFAKPALVLDIDETSISNWKQLYQNGFAYFPHQDGCPFTKGTACGQVAWEKLASAIAIQPTLELFNAAKAKHVTVFFITGRSENQDERDWIEKNLRNAGYEGWERIYMRTAEFGGASVAPFKTWARKDIERQYTIIANVGDQRSDLANGHAKRTFKVPNPFYYIQ